MTLLSYVFLVFMFLLLLGSVFFVGWALGFNDALSSMKEGYQRAVNTARGVPPELRDLTPLQWAKSRPAEVAKKQGYDANGHKIVKKEWSIY